MLPECLWNGIAILCDGFGKGRQRCYHGCTDTVGEGDEEGGERGVEGERGG